MITLITPALSCHISNDGTKPPNLIRTSSLSLLTLRYPHRLRTGLPDESEELAARAHAADQPEQSTSQHPAEQPDRQSPADARSAGQEATGPERAAQVRRAPGTVRHGPVGEAGPSSLFLFFR